MRIEVKSGEYKQSCGKWFEAFDIRIDQNGIIHIWNVDIDGKGQYSKIIPSDDHVEIVIDRLKEEVDR